IPYPVPEAPLSEAFPIPCPHISSYIYPVPDTSALGQYASLWPGPRNLWTCILCILYPLYRVRYTCVYSWLYVGSVCDPLASYIPVVSLVDPLHFTTLSNGNTIDLSSSRLPT